MDQKPFIPPAPIQEEPVLPQVTAKPSETEPSTPTPTPELTTQNSSTPTFAPAKKHTGRTILAIIAALVACGAILAIILLNLPQKDLVKTAIENFLDNTGNLHVDGSISFKTETPINLDINSDYNFSDKTSKNTIDASLDFNGANLGITIDTITTKDNKNYLKVNGIVDSLEESGLTTISDTATIVPILLLAQSVDNTWFAIDKSSISELLSSSATTAGSSQIVECFANNYPTSLSAFKDDLMENYFINSTKEGNSFRLSADREKFTAFANKTITSGALSKIYSCLGVNVDEMVEENNNKNDDTTESSSLSATIEVKNEKISNLYIEGNGDNITLIINLNFSYPDNITINAPEEYSDITDIFNPEFLTPQFSDEDYEIMPTELDSNSQLEE